MSRAKKSRKIRSANRRQKRRLKQFQVLMPGIEELRDRVRAREIVEASDLPDGLKRAFGLILDPVGAVGTIVREHVAGNINLKPEVVQMNHDDDDDFCEVCGGTGHHEDCDSRQPAWDVGDLICASPCDGCCPIGCKPHGLQKMQDDAQRDANALLGGRR